MGLTRVLLSRFTCKSHLFQIPRFFSTSATLIQRPWTYDLGDLEEFNGESSVYRHALRFQRPTSVKFHENIRNSVNLIGFIDDPLKKLQTASKRFGVYTSLKVNSSASAYRSFRVMLKFWDEMAEMAAEHLKLSDLIYVLGSLASNEMMDDDGKSIYWYQVNVTEVNFIIQHSLGSTCQSSLKLEPRVKLEFSRARECLTASEPSGTKHQHFTPSHKISREDITRKHKTRLHLWQVFFASPDEWWDNRNSKQNPNCPDFKHKDTGEALWLKDTDPPWVKKQLLLQDSRLMKRGSRKHINTLSHLSPMVYDDTQRN